MQSITRRHRGTMRRPYAIIAACASAASGFATVPRRHVAKPLLQQRTYPLRAAPAEADATETPGPTLRELAAFAGPAIVLWISGPLLTLIDTSAVGLASGAKNSALEIAALGPGGSVCDGATYFYTFLNIATTNFLASETEPEKRDQVVARGATLALRNGVLALIWLRLIARARPAARRRRGDALEALRGRDAVGRPRQRAALGRAAPDARARPALADVRVVRLDRAAAAAAPRRVLAAGRRAPRVRRVARVAEAVALARRAPQRCVILLCCCVADQSVQQRAAHHGRRALRLRCRA